MYNLDVQNQNAQEPNAVNSGMYNWDVQNQGAANSDMYNGFVETQSVETQAIYEEFTETQTVADQIASEQAADNKNSVKKNVLRVVFIVWGVLLAAVIAAAALWFLRDTSAQKIEEALGDGDYEEVVSIYNEKVSGHASREEKVDDMIEEAIDSIGEDYLAGKYLYEDASADLTTLTGIEKDKISQKAAAVLENVEIVENSANQYANGSDYYLNGDYVEAVKAFSDVNEVSEFYDQAQSQISLCVSAIVDEIEDAQNEDSFQDSLDILDTLLELLPGNTSLKNCKEKITELQETSADNYDSGMNYYEKKSYIDAITAFNAVSTKSEYFEDAQSQILLCVDKILDKVKNPKNEDDYREYLELVTSAFTLLPDNSDLLERKNELYEDYLSLVSGDALEAAEEAFNSGDYKTSFETLDAAIKVAAGDADLTAKLNEYHTLYVEYIKVEVSSLADSGKYDDALTMIQEAQGIYSCSEFNELYAEVEGKQTDAVESAKKYTGKSVAFLEYTGTINSKDDEKTYTITAPETGYYRFTVGDMVSGFSVRVIVYASDGTCVKSAFCSKDEGVSANLTKGNTYTVKVEGSTGTGTYSLKIGQQKSTVDISSNEVIYDSIEYKDQINYYKFTPEYSGVYRFDASELVNGFEIRIVIKDSLGYCVGSSFVTKNGGVSVTLDAGETYDVSVEYNTKLGDYTLSIGKQKETVDISGKTNITGTITYKDQRDVFIYTAGTSGTYTFKIGKLVNGFAVGLTIYDDLGYVVKGDSYMESSDYITASLESGKIYTIYLKQNSSTGDYSFSISK